MKSSFVEHIAASRINPVFEGSISMGRQAGTTVGLRSVAVGNNAVATGNYSGAIGNYTVAGGNGAVAVGNKSEASGNNSFASGEQTIANHRSQVAFGEYNVQDPNTTYSGRGTYVEIVGNGTSNSARSNARTLDWNGNEVLAGKLTVGAAPTNDMDAATKKYVDDAVESVDPAGCQEAAAAANAAATAANTAATEASRVNANVTKSGHTVSITTTNKSNVTTTKTIVEPTITVTQGSGDYDLSVTTSDGTQTVTIPNPNKELSDRAHVETVSRSKTRTGNPIQIEDAVNEIADKTVIKLVPKQDLHGYSKPWVGGAGKNLLVLSTSSIKEQNTNTTWNGNVGTKGGITFTLNEDNAGNLVSIKANGTATDNVTLIFVRSALFESMNLPAGTYSLKGCPDDSNCHLTAQFYDGSTSSQMQCNGNTISTKTYTNAPSLPNSGTNIYIWISSGATVSNVEFRPMLFAGSVDIPYEPYENKCPISGYDTVNTADCGKNLLKGVESGNYNGTGVKTSGDTRVRCVDYIPVRDFLTYTINAKPGNSARTLQAYVNYHSGKGVNRTDTTSWVNLPFTFTPPTGTKYILVGFRYSNDSVITAGEVVEPQIEVGSQATSYAPFVADSTFYPIAVSLATNGNQTAGTVYSGTVTLLADGSGQLVADKKSFLFDGSSSAAVMNVVNDRALYYDTSTSIPLSNYSTDYICDYSAPNTATSNTDALGTYVYSNRFRIRCPESWGTTLETLNAKLAENPVRIVCPLTTPEVYTLTANQVQTLLGYNYIYTDGAEIALTYRQESLATNETLLKLLPTGSASGNPVTFSDGADSVPLKQLVVNVQPNQDLHGYEKPWVGGAGKNKLKTTGSSRTVNGVTYSVKDDGSFSLSTGTGSATANTNNAISKMTQAQLPAGQYVLSTGIDTLGTGVGYFWCNALSGTTYVRQLANFNSSSASITIDYSDYDNIEVGCIINSGKSVSKTIYPMLRLSTASDTTWEPYENLCPIRGWDSVPIIRTGKNLFDAGIGSTVNKLRGDDGTESDSTSSSYTDAIGGFAPNTQYTIQGTVIASAQTFRLYFLDADKNFLSRTSSISSTPYTFTTPDNCYYVQLQYITAKAVFSTIQIEEGTTATAYESFKGKTYDISIPSEAGTVYGGTITLDENGEGTLTVDRGIVDLGSLSWTYGSNYFRTSGINTTVLRPSDNTTVPNAVSDFYEVSNWNTTKEQAVYIVPTTQSQSTYLWVADSSYTDATLFTNAVKGHQLVYPLATPVTYSLTADQVKTLLGTNIISSDAGTCEVEYFKNISGEPDLSAYATKASPVFTGSISLGRNSSSTIGNKSSAFGDTVTASGFGSHAEGEQTSASGDDSHAEGYFSDARGEAAHAEGGYTKAFGRESHAEGNNALASGTDSHAEGLRTTASGENSHAEGSNTTASGNTSHAEGEYTIASRADQHVFGSYNIADTSGITENVKGEYVEIVGNGTGANDRSNARTLDWSGNEWIAGSLTIGNTTLTEAKLQALLSLVSG